MAIVPIPLRYKGSSGASAGVGTISEGGAPAAYEKTFASSCSRGIAKAKKIVMIPIAIRTITECFIIEAMSLSNGCDVL